MAPSNQIIPQHIGINEDAHGAKYGAIWRSAQNSQAQCDESLIAPAR
jgi:hypothetical protein